MAAALKPATTRERWGRAWEKSSVRDSRCLQQAPSPERGPREAGGRAACGGHAPSAARRADGLARPRGWWSPARGRAGLVRPPRVRTTVPCCPLVSEALFGRGELGGGEKGKYRKGRLKSGEEPDWGRGMPFRWKRPLQSPRPRRAVPCGDEGPAFLPQRTEQLRRQEEEGPPARAPPSWPSSWRPARHIPGPGKG